MFNKEIFQQAKTEGYDFVIVKLGEYCREDVLCRFHVEQALQAGLAVGLYYFSHAESVEDAHAEAQWVINKIEEIGYTNWHLQAGIWYDYEQESLPSYGLSAQEVTNIMATFYDDLKAYGMDLVGVYSGYSLLWYDTYMYSQRGDIPVWVAQYNSECDYDDATIWQYSDKGNVCGYSVDVNEWFEYDD